LQPLTRVTLKSGMDSEPDVGEKKPANDGFDIAATAKRDPL